MRIKNLKGFTVLELMVTASILTALAGIAVPAFDQYKRTAEASTTKNLVSTFYTIEKALKLEMLSSNPYISQFSSLSAQNIVYYPLSYEEAREFSLAVMTEFCKDNDNDLLSTFAEVQLWTSYAGYDLANRLTYRSLVDRRPHCLTIIGNNRAFMTFLPLTVKNKFTLLSNCGDDSNYSCKDGVGVRINGEKTIETCNRFINKPKPGSNGNPVYSNLWDAANCGTL